MNDAFQDRGEVIVVAVAFDRHSIPLTEKAVALCRRTGKQLCLLHVVEPWMENPHSRPFGDGDPLWNVTQAVESSARDQAARHLEELATLVPEDVRVIKQIESGKPIDRIVDWVGSQDVCLLMVGVDTSNLRFMPRGFSTALSLMVASPIPVLVMDTSVPGEVTSDKTRLVVADDLGASSEAAVDFAFGLGAALGKAEIHHVHVNGLSYTDLKAGLETAEAVAHASLDRESSAARVFDAYVGDLEARLQARTEVQRDYLEAAGGTYKPAVITGTLAEGLGAEMESFDPHLLVFGRHHAYYMKPFFIGRLPYRSMLAYRRPIVIVPNETEIEAGDRA